MEKQCFQEQVDHQIVLQEQVSIQIIQVKLKKNEQMEVARAFSIIREASVPLGFEIPGEEPVTSTIWRIISDQKSLKYYIDPVVSPSTYWVDINKVRFKKMVQMLKLLI